MNECNDRQPIKLLPDDLRGRLRSEYCIDSVTSCVQQLVYNSIEAESNNVVVRLDLSFFNIQVTDDGHGISPDNLKLVGERYATNKYDGTRSGWCCKGESLSSIVSMSSSLQINSKAKNDPQNCCSKFLTSTEQRQSLATSNSVLQTSSGTSVIVRDFLKSVPVRRNLVQPTVEAEKVKKILQELSVVHPKINFSLFDAVHDVWRLKTSVFKSKIDAFCHHFGSQWQFKCRRFESASDSFKIDGFVSFYDGHRNRSLQFIYLHKRRVDCIALQEFIEKRLAKFCFPENYFPVFVINIRCPIKLCTFSGNFSRFSVEFQPLETLTHLISQSLGKISGTELQNCQNVYKDCQNLESGSEMVDLNSQDGSVKIGQNIVSNSCLGHKCSQNSQVLPLEDERIFHRSMKSSVAVKRPIIEPLFRPCNGSVKPQKIYLSSNKSYNSSLTDFCNKMTRQQRLDEAVKDLAKYGRKMSKSTAELTETHLKNVEKLNICSPLAIAKLPPRPWSKTALEKMKITMPLTVSQPQQVFSQLPSKCNDVPQQVIGCPASMENLPTFLPIQTRHIQQALVFTNSQLFNVTKHHLKNIKIIGQVDSRFISAVSQLDDQKRCILLFDQHAVHERILLERFAKNATIASWLETPLMVTFNDSQCSMAVNGLVAKQLADLGLKFQLNGNLVQVTTVPMCFANKEESKQKLKQSSVLCQLIIDLVDDVIQSVISTGTAGSVLPKTIIELLRSQACHAAIKFGEYLSMETCDQLLKQLSKCDLPFQCAHGRPSVVPLIQI